MRGAVIKHSGPFLTEFVRRFDSCFWDADDMPAGDLLTCAACPSGPARARVGLGEADGLGQALAGRDPILGGTMPAARESGRFAILIAQQ